jgi:hypothetical protein
MRAAQQTSELPESMTRPSLRAVTGSEICGNCGEPAQAWCIVSAGNDRMPGWLCGKCITKHKAEVVFPNAQGQARRDNPKA